MPFGQQLQLQGTSCIHVAGRGGHFRGHFHAQQSRVCVALCIRLKGLRPGLALGWGDPIAQLFCCRKLVSLPCFPSCQHVNQCLAMRLHGQAAQGVVGLL